MVCVLTLALLTAHTLPFALYHTTLLARINHVTYNHTKYTTLPPLTCEVTGQLGNCS